MRRILFAVLLMTFVAACSNNDDPGRFAFRLSLVNLPPLQGSAVYQGWARVGGIAYSTGRFVLDDTFTPARVTNPAGTRIYGDVTGATFGPASTGLGTAFPFIVAATNFFITIESEFDLALIPSGNVVMGGAIVGDEAFLSVTGEIAPGEPALPDLSTATGTLSLAAATGPAGMDQNGAWFVAAGAPAIPTLDLPALDPRGWAYEAWLSDPATGELLSMGRFRDASGRDFDAQTAPTREPFGIGFDAPGQDFVIPAVVGTAVPLDLATGDWLAFITIEPFPDNSVDPYPIPILDAAIPTTAVTMEGIAQEEILMMPLELPELAAVPVPGEVAYFGDAPGELGPITAGFYAAWAEIAGAPQMIGSYRVEGTQVLSLDGMTLYGNTGSFVLNAMNTGLGAAFPQVTTATSFFITQEPQGGPFGGPSDQTVLAGDVEGLAALLSVAGSSSRGIADLADAGGRFVLMTPTDGRDPTLGNDESGIWWRSLAAPVPSLVLPVLPTQWRYQGWVRSGVTGETWSTGTFARTAVPDDDAATWTGRGTLDDGFGLPGQDFVVADGGRLIPAPLDLRGFGVLVSLEPSPDTSLAPFAPLLTGTLPTTVLTNSAPLTSVIADLPRGRLTY